MTHTVGHVLPIIKNEHKQWQSGPWFLRAQRCYLFPGDSAMGYRLPLDSQPWAAEGDYPYVNPPDPSQTPVPLPSHAEIVRQSEAWTSALDAAWSPQRVARPKEVLRSPGAARRPTRSPGFKESAAWVSRAVRFPPKRATAGSTSSCPRLRRWTITWNWSLSSSRPQPRWTMPVIMEGYVPPGDPRLTHFSVTPDPGVIEVNIHPAKSWDQLVNQTTHLYDAAHLSRA